MCALCSCPCRCWAQPQWKCIHPINLKASCNSFPCPSTAVLRLQVWPGGRPAQDPLSLWSRQLPQVDELKAIDGGSGLWPATPNTHAFLLLVSYQLICFSFVLFFSVSLPWPFCQKKKHCVTSHPIWLSGQETDRRTVQGPRWDRGVRWARGGWGGLKVIWHMSKAFLGTNKNILFFFFWFCSGAKVRGC